MKNETLQKIIALLIFMWGLDTVIIMGVLK